MIFERSCTSDFGDPTEKEFPAPDDVPQDPRSSYIACGQRFLKALADRIFTAIGVSISLNFVLISSH